MQRTLLAFLAADTLGLVLLGILLWWYDSACLPFEVHTIKWQCEVQLSFLGLSFAISGALFGYLANRHIWLGSFAVALFILLVAIAFTTLLRPYYGANFYAAIVHALFFAVFPTMLASITAHSVRIRIARPARRSTIASGNGIDVSGYPVSTTSLLEGARNYYVALERLAANPKGEFIDPIGLLASQAVELALKAYLLHIGWSERDLRTRIGHNLRTAWQEATSNGLRIHWEHRFSVDVLSLSHDSPYLYRYPRQKVGAAITEPDVLCKDVNAVIESVENRVSS